MSKWLRRDDRVVVIIGNDKGKVGVIKKRVGDRILVEGVNIRKKTLKKREQQTKAAQQMIEIEMPIHISNVCRCDEDGKLLKAKVKCQDDGSKDLVYQKKGKEIVLRTIKKRVK